MEKKKHAVRNRYRLIFALMTMVLLAGCSQQKPEIFMLNGSDKENTDFKMTSQSATTESGITRSVFQFIDGQNSSLQITLAFRKEVPPIFDGGEFQLNSENKTFRGVVTQKNFRYLGGQGDGISVGGDFLFTAQNDHYQFHLPLTNLDTFSY